MAKSDWTTRPLEDELGEVLRAELLSWPGVHAKPMMGTLAFFKSTPRQKQDKHLLGCYVNRALSKTKPDWMNRRDQPTYAIVRLRPEDTARALRRKGVKESRLGFDNWVEIELDSRQQLEEAVRWFGTAYERPPRNKNSKRRSSTKKKPKKRTRQPA